MVHPLVLDPDRPWLYVNGDPGQGLNGDVAVTVGATGVSPGGWPLILELHQPGGCTHLTSAYFLPVPGGTFEASFVIPTGQVQVQNLELKLTVPISGGAPGKGAHPTTPAGFLLDYVTVDFLVAQTTGVPDPGGDPRKPTLLGSYPNPFTQSARIAGDAECSLDPARHRKSSRARPFQKHDRLIAGIKSWRAVHGGG